jgi:hypothetical protein
MCRENDRTSEQKEEEDGPLGTKVARVNAPYEG